MAHKESFGLLLALLLLSSSGAAVAQAPTNHPADQDPSVGTPTTRLAGDWRSSEAVTIPASQPALGSNSAIVLSPAPSGMRLDRMLLLLEPSAAQKQALTAELANQQNSISSVYHQWLTPAAFAAAYSNSSSDVAAVASWLESQGFQVGPLPAGLGWIEFSGTAEQVEQAFHTQVKSIAAAGVNRAVLTAGISVPAALLPVIHGLVSLDGVLSAPALTTPQAVKESAAELAAETSLSRAEAVPPQLLAEVLHLDALHNAGSLGAGETVAIAARSNVRNEDIAAFRTAFSLPASPLKVMLNGSDPGRTGDEAEAVIAASWAGAAAPGAQIVLVPAATTAATDGLDLSLAAIVDQALAHTVAVGYSACEAALSEAHQGYYSALYRQAAVEGMAVVAASGDSGPAACQAAGSQTRVSSGYGVNALASTPWNTAVGVAAFGSTGAARGGSTLAGWSPVSTADPAYAGGGGGSSVYAVPSWQMAEALSAAGSKTASSSGPEAAEANLKHELQTAGLSASYRLLPDLALPAAVDSGVNRGLAFCLSGPTASRGCTLVRAGGSAATAALFSGIAALVAEKYGRQGNLAPHLYALNRIAAADGVFDDVEQGNAQLACMAGSPGCGATGQIGFAASVGYDVATGLGSVNAQELVKKWPTPEVNGTEPVSSFTFSLNPATQNFYYNPSALVTFAATVTGPSGDPVPSQMVTFINATTGSPLSSSSAANLNNAGVASVQLNLDTLFTTLGTYEIGAVYSGDGTYYGPITSSEQQSMTTQKSTMVVTVSPSTSSPTAGQTITVTVTVAVDPASVAPAGSANPSGQVTLNLAGGPTAQSYTAQVSTAGGVTTATFDTVVVPGVGKFTLQAVYAGDSNYAGPTTSPSITIVVGQGTTTTTLAVTGTPTLGLLTSTYTLTATVAPSGTTPPVTGTVNFYDGSLLLGSAPVVATSAGYVATLTVALANNVSHNLRAVYSGDTNWPGSVSNIFPLAAITLADTVVLTASNLPVDPATGLPTASPGMAVILAATVTPAVPPTATSAEQYPSGFVDFYQVNAQGDTLIGREPLVRSGLSDISVATLITAKLPGGQDVLIAYYEGDAYYSLGYSNTLDLDIQDFAITPDASNPATDLDIVQGSSGAVIYDITGLGGFAGQIQVVCAVSSQDLPMTCTPSPQQVTPFAKVTFVVQTYDTGDTIGSNRRPERIGPRAVGGTALALLGFFLLPFGRRARIFAGKGTRRFLILLLLLVGLSGAGIGCTSTELSGTSSASGGTPLGVSTLKITASQYVNDTVFSRSVYLTVNVLVKPSS